MICDVMYLQIVVDNFLCAFPSFGVGISLLQLYCITVAYEGGSAVRHVEVPLGSSF